MGLLAGFARLRVGFGRPMSGAVARGLCLLAAGSAQERGLCELALGKPNNNDLTDGEDCAALYLGERSDGEPGEWKRDLRQLRL